MITLINFLSKFQCGFRKGFGAQNCLLYMIVTIRKTRDNHRVFAAVMTNSSKVFDYISLELSVAKINVYGYDEASLKVIISYLKNHTQTTKVGSAFSEFLNIIYDMVFHKDQSQLVWSNSVNTRYYLFHLKFSTDSESCFMGILKRKRQVNTVRYRLSFIKHQNPFFH